LPANGRTIAAFIGGEPVKREFGIDDRGRTIIGQLKLAWPIAFVAPLIRAMNHAAEARAE
jgi:hypothetical protein